MRKGIVVLVVAAAGTIGIIGSSSNAQAGSVPVSTVKVTQPYQGGDPMPQARGSSWQ
jgi:hypothetical protein